LAVSTGLQLAAPDDLFLFAKAAGSVLAAGLDRSQELLATGIFVLATGLLLLLPLGALLLLGLLSLALAIYLGWQGIEGLRLS
jgi:hypothetical protein